MKKILKSGSKRFWITVVILLLLPITILLLVSIALRIATERLPEADINEQQAEVLRVLPRILEDLKLLSEDPPFPVLLHTSDAEPYLSRFIPWRGYNHPAFVDSPSRKAMLDIWKSHEGLSGSPDNQFRALANDSNLEKVDTSWLELLQQYDHWGIENIEPIRSRLDKMRTLSGIERTTLYAHFPVPDYMELRKWTILHVLKSHKTGQAKSALKTYRHIGSLAANAGERVLAMGASVSLKDEARLVKFLNVKDWKPVSEKVAQAYKAVSYAWPSLIASGDFDEFPKELIPFLKPETGVCGSITLSLQGLPVFQDHMMPKFLFEKDYTSKLQRALALRQKLLTLCHKEAYQVMIMPIHADANPLFVSTYTEVLTTEKILATGAAKEKLKTGINWARIPFVRRFNGITLISFNYGGVAKIYEEGPQTVATPQSPE